MKWLLLTIVFLIGVLSAIAQVAPCNLSFTLSKPPCTFQTVALTNTSSFANIPGPTPVVMVNWGDNIVEQISSIPGTYTHYYGTPGTYTITLTGTHFDSVNNVTLCASTTSQQTTIIPQSPTISQVNNGSGSYTFTANTPGVTGLTYSWDFGDGSPLVTGSPVTHTYANPGGYNVSVNGTSSTCSYTDYTNVQYYNGSLNCNLDTAKFNTYTSGFTLNAYTWPTYPNLPSGVKWNSSWNFGDGTTDSTCCVSHTYLAGGSYTVSLVNQLIDSATNTVLCTSTTSQSVTIVPPPNMIEGNIYYDSVSINLAQTGFTVWLITHDPVANTLTAIDSTTVTSLYSVANYSFTGHPNGSYLIKAAPLPNSAGASSIVPTYHYSSLHWNTASTIAQNNNLANANISMQNGIPTSGPGFVSGNISQGANKGTGASVPNLLVALLNSATQLVQFTYTDANGDYSFTNLGYGTYTVYPESINYATTAASNLTISSSQEKVTGIHFKQTSTEIKPVPTGVDDLSENSLFSIYPNPSKGDVQIEWAPNITGKANITVTDVTGREVKNQEVATREGAVIKMSGLQPGVYFFRVRHSNSEHTKKIMLY